jgi:Matrixin
MRRLLVVSAVIAFVLGTAHADAYRLEGGKWRLPAIPYYVATPAYSWSVDTAAYAWNTSGVHTAFVKTDRAHAKVLVGIRWYKQAGDAHIQRVGNSIVSAQVGVQSGHDRYEIALIVAHEFGHVLGLDHQLSGCATMNPSITNDHTTYCPGPPTGMWTCRLLQPDDVRGAVALYGGSVRPWRGSSFCNR